MSTAGGALLLQRRRQSQLSPVKQQDRNAPLREQQQDKRQLLLPLPTPPSSRRSTADNKPLSRGRSLSITSSVNRFPLRSSSQHPNNAPPERPSTKNGVKAYCFSKSACATVRPMWKMMADVRCSGAEEDLSLMRSYWCVATAPPPTPPVLVPDSLGDENEQEKGNDGDDDVEAVCEPEQSTPLLLTGDRTDDEDKELTITSSASASSSSSCSLLAKTKKKESTTFSSSFCRRIFPKKEKEKHKSKKKLTLAEQEQEDRDTQLLTSFFHLCHQRNTPTEHISSVDVVSNPTKWSETNKANSRTIVAFHGTTNENAASIAKDGFSKLLMADKRGFFFARHALMASNYACWNRVPGVILVCAIQFDASRGDWYKHFDDFAGGEYCIQDASDVVPLLVIKWKHVLRAPPRSPSRRPASQSLLRTVTYNIHGGIDHAFISAVTGLFSSLEPDIVVLQEVPQHKAEDIVTHLKDSVFVPHSSGTSGQKERLFTDHKCSTAAQKDGLVNVILSRYPLLYKSRKRLGGSRSVVSGFVAEKKMWVFGVHLDVVTETQRLLQLEKIMEFATQQMKKEDGPSRFLIAGDFNALNQSDYSADEWTAICTSRKKYYLEPATSAVYETMTRKHNMIDARSLNTAISFPSEAPLTPHHPKCATHVKHGTRIDYIFYGIMHNNNNNDNNNNNNNNNNN
eukprot:PhM_4_TR15183/c2_g1_i1/m.41423